jgi:ribonuclease J
MPGFAPSESLSRDGLARIFNETEGRLFLATFSSHIHRVQIALDLAKGDRRKVCVVGRSMEKTIAYARRLGLLNCDDDIFIDSKDVEGHQPHKILILCTGSQAEPLSGLSRILKGEAKGIHPSPGDRLVLSARPIPGNEVPIIKMLDRAARLGLETSTDGFEPIHVTGHAHRDDAAMLMDLLKPEYVIPAHGTYRLLQSHAQLAHSKGWGADKAPLLDGGQCLQLFSDGTSRLAGEVPTGKCFVHQGIENRVDARVVHDRLIMQEDGIIIATIQLNKHGQLVGEPTILSRGFVILNDDEAYSGLLKETVRKAFAEAPMEVIADRELLSELLRQSLKRIIRKTTQTRPIIVPMILDAKKG